MAVFVVVKKVVAEEHMLCPMLLAERYQRVRTAKKGDDINLGFCCKTTRCMAWRCSDPPKLECRTRLPMRRASQLGIDLPLVSSPPNTREEAEVATIHAIRICNSATINPDLYTAFPDPNRDNAFTENLKPGSPYRWGPAEPPFFDEDDVSFVMVWSRDADPDETGYCGMAGHPAC